MLRYFFIVITLFSFCLSAQNPKKSVGFIENKGQIIDQKERPNPSVKYLLNTRGLNVQLKKNGFSYDVYETEQMPMEGKGKRENMNLMLRDEKKGSLPDYTLKYIFHRVDVTFEGSKPDVVLVAEGKSKDYDNYYTVLHAPEGVLRVHQYERVTYKDLYPNIDMVFFVPEDASKVVEYNFIVRPGGKVSDIRMKFDGVKTELVDEKIKMQTRFGTMEETLPLSWTEDGTERREIAIGYKKLKKNVYGFAGGHGGDADKTLVIDPVPIRLWGTYYGGNGGDYSTAICNDSSDNVYFSGYTGSTVNIATIGTFPVPYYYSNGFIAKFDENGVRQWGIYYSATPAKIRVDADQNVYFTGHTWGETNVSTPGSHQPSHADYDDAYLVKLNPSGIRQWGTYYGGNTMDQGLDISFDADSNVYLAGEAASFENIGTSGTHQPSRSPGNHHDSFIAKFSPNGIRIWGTYFGGNHQDRINSINIGTDGFLYVTGSTMSSDNIATPGSYNETLTGYYSGFIAKFNLNGHRIWGSYFNGATFCEINKSVLKDNYLYLTGITNSTNNLNSAGTFNTTFIDLPMNFGRSSYAAKFDVSTQNLIWGTYFGEFIQDIAVNSNDNLFLHGCTSQTEGIATSGAYKEVPQHEDAYVIKLNENGQRIWGTYYGGNFYEGYNGAAGVNNKISIDENNNLYLVGNTQSTAGISTPGSHQENYMLNSQGGLYSIYLAKLQDCLSSPQVDANAPCIGSDLELTAYGGTNYSWMGPNGFTSLLQNPIIPSVTIADSGEYFCTITGTGGCDGTLSVIVTVGDAIAPIPDAVTLPSISGTCDTLTIPVPTATDACMGAITGTTASPLTYTLEGTYTIVWNYDDGNGNISTQNQTVVVNPQPLPTTNTAVTFCIQENKTLAGLTVSGQNIQWYDSQTGGNLLPATTLLQDNHTYYVSQTINGCESNRVPIVVTVNSTPPPTGIAIQNFCAAQNLTLADFALTGTAIIFYDSPTGGNVLPIATPLVDGGSYWASQTLDGCESTSRLALVSNIINDLPANDVAINVCDNLNDSKEKVDLSFYNEEIIAASNGYSFTYYDDFNSAENEIAANKITDFENYELQNGTTTLYVRVENNTLCHKIVELKLTLIAAPILYMADTYGICEGSSKTITADAGFYTYNWSDTSMGQSITVTQPGTYSVTVTEYHGDVICSTTKNITVVASNRATITSIKTFDWTSHNNMITILVTGLGNYEYSIDGENYQTSNQFTGLENGEYTVYVRDINGCGIAKEDVYLLMYPKFFTPNGDGYNDKWGIKFYQNELNMIVKIFDRYGKFIKQLTDTDPFWDGTYNGEALPATDYWFSVTREDGREHKGHFSLKR